MVDSTDSAINGITRLATTGMVAGVAFKTLDMTSRMMKQPRSKTRKIQRRRKRRRR